MKCCLKYNNHMVFTTVALVGFSGCMHNQKVSRIYFTIQTFQKTFMRAPMCTKNKKLVTK